MRPYRRLLEKPEAVTHWEGLHKNRVFSKTHRNFLREILPSDTVEGRHLTFPTMEEI